jgi:hypothetical protein
MYYRSQEGTSPLKNVCGTLSHIGEKGRVLAIMETSIIPHNRDYLKRHRSNNWHQKESGDTRTHTFGVPSHRRWDIYGLQEDHVVQSEAV